MGVNITTGYKLVRGLWLLGCTRKDTHSWLVPHKEAKQETRKHRNEYNYQVHQKHNKDLDNFKGDHNIVSCSSLIMRQKRHLKIWSFKTDLF